MLHWSFILFLMGTVGQQSSAVNLQTMCNGRPYGTLLPNPQDCNSYYVCQTNPQLAYCNYGLHFDRVHKVCNWPDVANCKLVDVDDEEENLQLELNEDKSQEEPQNSIKLDNVPDKIGDKSSHVELSEESVIDSETEDELSHVELPEENLIDSESEDKPSHIELPEENMIDSESDLNLNGVESVITSSLSEDSNSKPKLVVNEVIPEKVIEITGSTPENKQVFAVKIPAVTDKVQTSNSAKNSTHVVKVPVVIPAKNEDNELRVPAKIPVDKPEIVNHPTLVVQVPSVVATEIPVSTLDGPVVKIVKKNNNGKEVIQESEDSAETSIPSNQQAQVIELPSKILQVEVAIPEAGSAIPSSEKINISKPSQSTNQVIELVEETIPVAVADLEAPMISLLTPNADLSPSIKVIEISVPPLPEEVFESQNAVPFAEGSEIVFVNPKDDLKPSGQVIEVPVSSLPEEAFEAQNFVPFIEGPEIVLVSPKDDLKPSGQVIELPVPSLQEEVSEAQNAVPFVEGPEIVLVSPKDDLKPSGQVIDISVQPLPEEVFEDQNAVPLVEGPEIVLVSPKDDLKPSGQVIDISVQSLPEDVFEAQNAVPLGEGPEIVLVSPKDDLKPSGQVIDILVQSLPEDVFEDQNTVPFGEGPEIVLVSPKDDLKPSGQVIELLVPTLPEEVFEAQNAVPSAESPVIALVSPKVDSKPSAQVIELSVPSYSEEDPVFSGVISVKKVKKPSNSKNTKNQIIEHYVDDESDDLSLSSSQLSSEDIDSDVVKSSEESIPKKKKKHNLKKVEKVVVSNKNNKASSESQQSSEQSPELEENVMQPGEVIVDSQEHSGSSDSLESSEENNLLLSEHPHADQSSKVEAIPLSSEEIILPPNINEFNSDESKDSGGLTKKNVLKPNHHQTLGEFTLEKVIMPHKFSDSQSSEEKEAIPASLDSHSSEGSSEEGLLQHINSTKVDKPTKPVKGSSKETGNNNLHQFYLELSEENTIVVSSNKNKTSSESRQSSEQSRESDEQNGSSLSEDNDMQSSKDGLGSQEHDASSDSLESLESKETNDHVLVLSHKDKSSPKSPQSSEETREFSEQKESPESEENVMQPSKVIVDSQDHDASRDSLEALESKKTHDPFLVSSSKDKPSPKSPQSSKATKESSEQKESPESEENDMQPSKDIVDSQDHDAPFDSHDESLESKDTSDDILHKLDPKSSEENKVVASNNKNKASSESRQSQEESIESDEQSESLESEENVMQPSKDIVDSKELDTSSDSLEPSEENESILSENLHSDQRDKGGAVPVSSEEVLLPLNLNKFNLREHKNAYQSTKKNDLESSNPHHQPIESIVESSKHSDSQSSEEDLVRPHQTIGASADSQSSESSSEEESFHDTNSNKVDKPIKPLKELAKKTDDKNPQYLPTPADITGTIRKPILPKRGVNLLKKHFNLIASVLSVSSFRGNDSTNGTINRPIVGAHNTKTGYPIDVMNGYNSQNVQCIHNGLYFLPHPSSCQKYFICAYRHLHMHSCGRNLIWNYKREQCEFKSNSRCYSNEPIVEISHQPGRDKSVEETVPVTEEVTIESTHMPPLRTTEAMQASVGRDSMLPKCPAIRQIYLPSLDDCNKYYICIMGHAVLTSCPDNMYWDARGEFCGNATDVICAGR